MNRPENVIVSIICNTYNHEPYIRQCLEGFVMQQTTFLFEILIHDDASTDKTANIIREYEAKYPDIIKPIYQKENQYSKKIGIMKTFQIPRVKGKYIALCEGDDYWIDPLKLQKQVDFLEMNPSYSLCHTNFNILDIRNNTFTEYKNSHYTNKIDKISDIILGNKYRIQTNTVLFKSEDYNKVVNSDDFLYKSGFFLMGDTQLWIGLLQLGNIHCIDDITAVYRVLPGSACRNLDIVKKFRFDLNCSELRLYLLKHYINAKSIEPYIQKEYDMNLLRYKLFDMNYTPLYPFSTQYHLIYLVLKYTQAYRLLKRNLIDKYSNDTN